MSEFLEKVFSQIKSFVGSLTPQKQLALVGTGVTIVAFISWLFYIASEKTFTPLMTNLAPEDSANIIRVLRSKGIPFRVDSSGANIEVPPENVLDLRMELATTGLPESGLVGYEIFDKQALGTTSFVQKLNEKRALEGELMRTIGAVRGVRRARVHLAIPQKSTFVEDQKEPTASVVLDLESGTVLTEKQVWGVQNLVSRSVSGLTHENVMILDNNGKTLSKNNHDPLVAMSVSQAEFKQKSEQEMEKRIESILSRVVGEGHVVARVSADLDFSDISETQTQYDADGSAVVSVVKDNASMEGTRPSPGGAPGVRSNTPGELGVGADGLSQVKSDTKKIKEVTNYKVPETIRRVRKPSGTIKKLSVAVVVDGKQSNEKGEDGRTLAKVNPWSPEQLKEFEKIVASTIGLDLKRGDTIDIKNMEFKVEDLSDVTKQLEDAEYRAFLLRAGLALFLLIVIIAFFWFVVRPFIKWVTENTIDSVDSFLPQTLEELEKLQKKATLAALEEAVPVIPERVDPEKVEGEMLKEKIVTMIDANPQKAAMIFREWVRGKKEPGKDAQAG